MRSAFFTIGIFVIILTSLAVVNVNNTFAVDQESQLLYSVEELPFNRNFDQWQISWWQWILSMPQGKNAMNDATGALCAENQNDKNVWYLTGGNSGDKIVRNCEVPFGKALFFADGNQCNHGEYPEYANDDLKALQKCAIEGNLLGPSGFVKATFDGTEITKITSTYNLTSTPFDVNITDNYIFPANPGIWNAMANAYVLFLKPPSKGIHQLHIEVLHNEDPKNVYTYEVTYNLSIK